MGLVVLFLALLLCVEARGSPTVSTEPPPPPPSVTALDSEQSTTTTTTPPPSATDNSNQDSNREPNPEPSSLAPTDNDDEEEPQPPPWLRLPTGNRFFYQVPISPETDIRPEYWRFRSQPFYRQQVASRTDAEPEETFAPVREETANEGQEQPIRDEQQEEEAEASAPEVDQSGSDGADERTFQGAQLPELLRQSPFELLPFGEDRPAFRLPLPPLFSGGEQGPETETSQVADDPRQRDQNPEVVGAFPGEGQGERGAEDFQEAAVQPPNDSQDGPSADVEEQPLEENGEQRPRAKEGEQEQEQEQERGPEQGEEREEEEPQEPQGGEAEGEPSESLPKSSPDGEQMNDEMDGDGDDDLLRPTMQFQRRHGDGSKWFDDPRPFDFGYDQDMAIENMVENEMELRRGNFDRSFP